MILIDTDVLIEIFDKNSRKGDDAFIKIKEIGEDVITTSINLHEILYGLLKYGNVDKIDKILLLDILELHKEDAVKSAELEVEMEKKGKKISRTDSMIASIALNKGLKLFTYNKKHFEEIPDLELI